MCDDTDITDPLRSEVLDYSNDIQDIFCGTEPISSTAILINVADISVQLDKKQLLFNKLHDYVYDFLKSNRPDILVDNVDVLMETNSIIRKELSYTRQAIKVLEDFLNELKDSVVDVPEFIQELSEHIPIKPVLDIDTSVQPTIAPVITSGAAPILLKPRVRTSMFYR